MNCFMSTPDPRPSRPPYMYKQTNRCRPWSCLYVQTKQVSLFLNQDFMNTCQVQMVRYTLYSIWGRILPMDCCFAPYCCPGTPTVTLVPHTVASSCQTIKQVELGKYLKQVGQQQGSCQFSLKCSIMLQQHIVANND